MAGRSAWVAGNGVGLTWTTAVNSADLASMTSGDSVLSSVTDIANGTNLDQFMDISMKLVISSSTIALGANIAFYIYPLNEDGSTYGDGQFASGTPSALLPTPPPCAIMSIPPVASTTNMYGQANGIIIPPGAFRIVCQNNSGFNLTSGTQAVKYRTYNQNLNN